MNTNAANIRPATYYDEEKLWNEEWIFPTIRSWKTGIVLCSNQRLEEEVMRKLARVFANKVDKAFGSVKKGKAYDISQRIEKIQMLEYGDRSRGWHVNVLLSKPAHIKEFDFIFGMGKIWRETLPFDCQPKTSSRSSEIYWAEDLRGKFYRYAVKQRSRQAENYKDNRVFGLSKSPNDFIVTETLTFHEKTINSKDSI